MLRAAVGPAGTSQKQAGGAIAVLECPPGRECDEADFLYLLAVERARAERSHRPLRLLFATMEPSPGSTAPIPPGNASRLFRALKAGLRETDVMGWYQQGRVAAAVLSPGGEPPGADTSDAIEDRVGESLRQHLPSKVARSLKVRVVQVPPRVVVDE